MRASQITLCLGVYWLAIGLLARVFTNQWNVWFIVTAIVFNVVAYWLTKKELREL